MQGVRKIILAGHLAVAVCLSSCGPVAPAGNVDFEGRNISKVKMVYKGKKTVDESRLRGVMITKAHTRYAAEKLDEDIKSLYSTGYTDDVRIVAEPDGENVRVVVEVSTRPVLCCSAFAGNTLFKDEKLAKESGLRKDAKWDEAAIRKGGHRIERYYHRHDYPQAKVTIRVWPGDEPWTERFIYVVDEGPKVETSWLQRLGIAGSTAGP